MSLSVTYTESPNTVVRSARWNRNFDDVEDWANAHEIDGTAVHGVTGTIVGTTDAQTLSNKIFDLTDVKIYGGYDLKLYSNSGTTLKASIDGATGNTSLEGTLGVTGASTLTGNVGIGASTTPDSALHIFNGSAGAVTALAGTNLTIEASGANNYLSFLSSNTSSQSIIFGDTDLNNAGSFGYNHNGDYAIIYTNGAERLRIGSTGTVGIISGQKLFLDGVALTGNTSIRESASDVITFEAGGSDVVGMSTTSMSLSSALQFNIQTTKKLFFDGGTNTSIRESAADIITFEVGGSDRLAFNSAAVTNNFMTFSNTAQTTANIIDISNADSLTTGSIFNFASASGSASARALGVISQTGSVSSARCLSLNQSGTGDTLLITNTSTGIPIKLTTIVSSASNVYGIVLDIFNSGAGRAIGIDLSGPDTAFLFDPDATDPTGGGGAATGRIKCLIGGVTRYIPYY